VFSFVVTPPAFEPVTLPEARRQLRLTGQVDDVKVNEAIKSARKHVEDISSRALAIRVVEVRFSCVEPLELPLGHVETVSSISYLDIDGALQTADPSTYRIETGSAKSRVQWLTRPEMYAANDSIRVRYSVGYAAPSDIPTPLIQAVLLVLADCYESRTPQPAVLNSVAAMVAPWDLS